MNMVCILSPYERRQHLDNLSSHYPSRIELQAQRETLPGINPIQRYASS